jgi:hypothetical protein
VFCQGTGDDICPTFWQVEGSPVMFALGGNDISEDQRDKCSSHIVELDERVPEVLIHTALSA